MSRCSELCLVAILTSSAVGSYGCDGETVAPDADTPGMDAGDVEVDAGDDACPDSDGDGHRDAACGGDDCDDENPNRYPGNEEVCDSAGIDEDCDPSTFAAPGEGDADGDGYVSQACCNVIDGEPRCGRDCDDDDPAVNPGASDVCGGGDGDCDGAIDEDPDERFYRDVDGDGYGSEDDRVFACGPPDGYVALGGDCDDTRSGVNPEASEVCDGSLDEDCDRTVDEGCPCTIGEVDDTCGPAGETGACQFGTRTCGDDGMWGECVGAVTPTAEICNGGDSPADDEDCDGMIDEAGACECTNGESRFCRAPGASSFGAPSICNEIPQTCDDGRWPRDCSDEPLIEPMTEVCDTSHDDEDCDGQANEGCPCDDGDYRTCSTDVGECTPGGQVCDATGTWSTCTGDLPTSEVCDHLDQDCDGTPDDGVSTSCSWGDTTSGLVSTLTCLPGSNCAAWGPGHLQLGWNLFAPWAPGSGAEEARVAYLEPAVDWGALASSVSARVSVRKMSTSSIGHGRFGVLMSPVASRGSESDDAIPQLGAGQTGWAAVYDTLTHLVRLYELQDGADPVVRSTSSALGCGVTTSYRDFTVELSHGLGQMTASVRSPGCGSTQTSVTLTDAQFDALYGRTSSYPTYFPGVLGNDLSGGVVMLLERMDVERSLACDSCPW